MYLQLLGPSGITAANGPPVATKANITLTTVAAGLLVDGDSVIVDDGWGKRAYIEFDTDGKATDAVRGGPIGGPLNKILIALAAQTADQIRDALVTAIAGAGLDATVTGAVAATVNITANRAGAGKLRASENVANAGFTVAVVAAGSLSGVPMIHDRENLDTLEVWSVGATAPISLLLKMWEFTWRAGVWLPMSQGPAAAAIVPASGNDGGRAEYMFGLTANPDYVFLDVSSTFGGSTVFAHLTGKGAMLRRSA